MKASEFSFKCFGNYDYALDTETLYRGLIDEISSLLPCIRLLLRKKLNGTNISHILETVGECYWYIAALCNNCNISFEDCFVDRLPKITSISSPAYEQLEGIVLNYKNSLPNRLALTISETIVSLQQVIRTANKQDSEVFKLYLKRIAKHV